VDGVVTEDSDAILFGAKTIYKNIFNDKKFVEVGNSLFVFEGILLLHLTPWTYIDCDAGLFSR
jgi:hypothetical protein